LTAAAKMKAPATIPAVTSVEVPPEGSKRIQWQLQRGGGGNGGDSSEAAAATVAAPAN